MIKQYVVDAFADKLFQGNTAAVCILDTWLADDLLEAITMENNLSETAFAVKEGDIYHLRWFTPGGEIDLCGHATLATAFVIKNFYEQDLAEIVFETLSGKLFVGCQNNLFCLNFPSYEVKEIPVTQEMIDLLGVKPKKAYLSRDLVCVMENEKQVLEYVPDLMKIMQLEGLILHYDEKFRDDFIKLNKHWIQKYFKMEEHDLEQLENIEEGLEQGAMIYFAIEDEEVLSTCIALRLQEDVWEIAKFATNEKFQGRGAGKAVFKAAMDYAIEQGAKKIMLYSNQILKPAIHIYHSFGFKEVPVDIDDYDRCDYQAELVVNHNDLKIFKNNLHERSKLFFLFGKHLTYMLMGCLL